MWFRAEFSCAVVSGLSTKTWTTLPGSFVSALFWTIPVLFGFGILYVVFVDDGDQCGEESLF